MTKETFITLGKIFESAAQNHNTKFNNQLDFYVEKIISAAHSSKNENGWFTIDFVNLMLHSLAEMLNEDSLNKFYDKYQLQNINFNNTKVKIIAAGNIPLVCFHDIFCVIAAGCKCILKPSSKDRILPTAVIDVLTQLDPQLKSQITIETENKEPFDAIIATGSNNSGRYFDYYFSKIPHIIRRGRSSVAIITGNETSEDYAALSNDIFDYYGLGCRNVSKIYVPQFYDYNTFFSNIIHKSNVMQNPKYSDNYTYNKAIYLMSGETILDNNFVLLKEDHALTSPMGVIYAERYNNISELVQNLNSISENIQCVVSSEKIEGLSTVKPGMAQHPSIFDYADGIDTMQFLLKL